MMDQFRNSSGLYICHVETVSVLNYYIWLNKDLHNPAGYINFPLYNLFCRCAGIVTDGIQTNKGRFTQVGHIPEVGHPSRSDKSQYDIWLNNIDSNSWYF